jgi:heat shock protein HslJ
MRHRNVLLMGSLASLSLVIALGVIWFWAIPSPSVASLDGVLWTLTSLQVNGQTYDLVPRVPVTLTFHASSHTITGSDGCNDYSATYQLDHSQIHFQPDGSTLVGCLDPVAEQESRYNQALFQAETLLVSANVLTITGAGGKDLLRFSSSPQELVSGEPCSSGLMPALSPGTGKACREVMGNHQTSGTVTAERDADRHPFGLPASVTRRCHSVVAEEASWRGRPG